MAKLSGTLADLVDRETLNRLARNGFGPEGIAEKVIPENLYMRDPPTAHCVIRDKVTGAIRSGCSVERAESYYAKRADVTIEHRKPHPYHLGLWRWNQARLAEIEAVWNEQAAANLIHYDDVGDLHGLDRALASAAGASRWRKIGPDDFLDYAIGFGGRGKELLTSAGRLFLDAGADGGRVLLAQIAVEKPGTGLGSLVLEAARSYATEHNLGVCIFKVCNERFSSRFAWLEPNLRIQEFTATAAGLREFALRQASSEPEGEEEVDAPSPR